MQEQNNVGKTIDNPSIVRPVARVLAREITADEIRVVGGGDGTGCNVWCTYDQLDQDRQK